MPFCRGMGGAVERAAFADNFRQIAGPGLPLHLPILYRKGNSNSTGEWSLALASRLKGFMHVNFGRGIGGFFVRTRFFGGGGLGDGWGWVGMGLLRPARGLCFLDFLALLATCVAAGRSAPPRRGRCRVVAAYAFARFVLAGFFCTISHCPWRDFISMSVGLGRRRVVAAYVIRGFYVSYIFYHY
jgi:hypothetical protein